MCCTRLSRLPLVRCRRRRLRQMFYFLISFISCIFATFETSGAVVAVVVDEIALSVCKLRVANHFTDGDVYTCG